MDSLRVTELQSMAVMEYRNFEAPWLHLKPCHLNKFSSQYIETESDAGYRDEVIYGTVNVLKNVIVWRVSCQMTHQENMSVQ